MSLLAQIRALPAALLALKDTQAIADALPPVVTVSPHEIGKGRVLSALGFDAGNALLDTIDNVADFRHVKQLVANGWLDVGDPLTREMIDQVCSPADATKLKALAETSAPVSEYAVRCACWADNGDWLV